jgi:ribosomal protein S11
MARPSKKISLRKGKRAPKGVIHVQASFNNTIVTEQM